MGVYFANTGPEHYYFYTTHFYKKGVHHNPRMGSTMMMRLMFMRVMMYFMMLFMTCVLLFCAMCGC